MHYSTFRKAIVLFVAFLATSRSFASTADYHVTHYTSENGLPQNSVKGLQLDKDGFLWIGTEAGMVRFDGQRFKVYDRDGYPLLHSNRMRRVELDTAGVVCFVDEDFQKYTFDRTGHLRMLQREAYTRSIPLFRNDHLWAMEHTLSFTSKGKVRWEMIVPELVSGNRLNLWGRLNHKCYFLGNNGSLIAIDAQKNRSNIRITGLPPHLAAPVNNAGRQYALFEQDNMLWYYTGKAIYQLTETGPNAVNATLVLETDITDISFFRNYPALNLQLIGTATQGLYLLRRKQFATHKHTNGFGNFYSQVPYGDSSVLVYNGIVYPGSSRWGVPFIKDLTAGVLRDSRGHYWMHKAVIDDKVHYNQSLVELDENLNELKAWPKHIGSNCIRETPDGRIWLSSQRVGNLRYVDGDSLRSAPGRWAETQLVRTFLPLDNENFWIAGMRILALLNVKTGKQIQYKMFEKDVVETLHLDRNKVLWVGTTGKGFYAIRQGRVIKMPLDKYGSLKDVHSFMEDRNGFIWMSTNNGLFRCRKADLDLFVAGKVSEVYYQCFKRDSGFNTNEFNGSCTPSAVVLGNGKFSFPSMDGLVQFQPDAIQELLPVSKIIIDKLLVDGQPQYPAGRSLDLEPDFKYLEVQVASPFFGNPANQQLEYRLTGLDSIWQPLKEDNTVVFNNLTHGNYSLQLRKRAGFGINNVVMTNIPLFVKPFFYQTLYFKLIVLLVIALLVYAIVKLRYAYLLQRNRELAHEVASRTAHLNNANRLKEKMLMMVGHDLQSPLHFLGYLSEANYEAVMSDQTEKAGSISRQMQRTSRKIYAFVDEFSLWARVQDEQFNLKKAAFSLTSLVDELEAFCRDLLKLHDNTFEFKTEEEYALYTNKELLKAILRNLIENAHKHTHHGTISVHCSRDSDMTCVIRVSDTGNGMRPDVLEKINGLIGKAGTIGEFDSGERLGYQFIGDFAARLNARLTIQSREGAGTTVLVSGIPLHQVDRQEKASVKARK
ncbi:Signal transduction histidine kinase [Dyadobacter sp. SG02]|uniref:sensor histidine kinase n=1 Tax=Dyadobacter sp. SG02 TaxID=1855291 RepID=UPI0008BC235D|nr:sensor histidine kinase [Dyadobacter sp. SG02]SEI54892.1 Signal transduction histidine kinase [Dyadobacter sp. SG02]